MKFGLENMTRLTEALGHPERTFRSVHVAGTNGKGSVTAMLETALRFAGHRSARYTSPHLERLAERFVLHGRMAETEALTAAVAEVRRRVEQLQAATASFAPTFFECATAAAFVLFRSAEVDIAVLETGLGGRLDATNVVTPVATAITSIDFDHQALLGDTLASIALEKAGIIKPRVPVVIGRLPPEARVVIARVAAERAAPLIERSPLEGVRPRLPGRHQADNAAVAAALAAVLHDRGVDLPERHVRRAIEEVDWPARLERIDSGGHEILLDAAHNPAGARAVADYLEEISWTGAVLVFGAMADKDGEGMLAALSPAVSHIVCTTAPGARAAVAENLAAIARGIHRPDAVHVEPDPAAAVGVARGLGTRIVIAGSMFLVGPLRGILR